MDFPVLMDREHKDDFRVGELIGKFDAFVERYERDILREHDRQKTMESRIISLETIVADWKVPSKVFVWSMRLIAGTLLVGIGSWIMGFIKTHLK